MRPFQRECHAHDLDAGTHAPVEDGHTDTDAAMQPVSGGDHANVAAVTDAERVRLRDELHRLAVARAVIALPPNARVVSLGRAWGHSANDFHAPTMATDETPRQSGGET